LTTGNNNFLICRDSSKIFCLLF